jgi:hypothetical protein
MRLKPLAPPRANGGSRRKGHERRSDSGKPSVGGEKDDPHDPPEVLIHSTTVRNGPSKRAQKFLKKP